MHHRPLRRRGDCARVGDDERFRDDSLLCNSSYSSISFLRVSSAAGSSNLTHNMCTRTYRTTPLAQPSLPESFKLFTLQSLLCIRLLILNQAPLTRSPGKVCRAYESIHMSHGGFSWHLSLLECWYPWGTAVQAADLDAAFPKEITNPETDDSALTVAYFEHLDKSCVYL